MAPPPSGSARHLWRPACARQIYPDVFNGEKNKPKNTKVEERSDQQGAVSTTSTSERLTHLAGGAQTVSLTFSCANVLALKESGRSLRLAFDQRREGQRLPPNYPRVEAEVEAAVLYCKDREDISL